MKIGYVILCHKDPELVAAIANRVTIGTNNIAVIHVDAKSEQQQFERYILKNDQIYFLKKRTAIYWGGFSSVIATMEALELASSFSCDRYVLLQGCDYPLHSNEYIADFFEQNQSIEFLKAYNITRSKKKINYMKCYGYNIYDGIDRSQRCLSTFVARGFTAINKIGVKYRRGYYQDKKTGGKYEVFWGWAHFALTHDCICYILDVYKNNEGLNKYFRHVFPADETYIQTVVYNSPFRDKVRDGGAVDENNHLTVRSMLNLTYFEYPDHVVVFNDPMQISTEIKENFLYVRKVSWKFIFDSDIKI